MARILIVDDDRQFRWMLDRLLTERGHEVRMCGDGSEIEDALKGHDADLVFLDMVMEKKGGLDSLRDLHARHPGVRVVLVSGNDMEFVRNTFAASGATGAAGYLQKPFTADGLYRIVADVLGE